MRVVTSSGNERPVEIGLRGQMALVWAQQAAMDMSLRGWASEVFELRPDGEEVRAFRAAPGEVS